MLTQDDCKQAAFSWTWAAINGKPLTSGYYYQLGHLQYDDLPPDIYYLGETLGSTDGAGNEVRFSFTTTLSPEWEWMDAKTQIYKGQTQEYYRFFMKSGLTWGDVKEMLNYGTGISIHDVNIDNEEITVDNLLKHYDIALNIIKEKLSGRGCKMLAKPSGIAEYITAGQVHSSIQTMTSNDGETICPAKTENDLKKVVLNRGFYSIEDLKKKSTNSYNYHRKNEWLSMSVFMAQMLLGLICCSGLTITMAKGSGQRVDTQPRRIL